MSHKSGIYIIAEAGVNHNGSLDTAVRMVDVAADSGANAVKFQTFKAERIISRKAPKADYQTQHTDPAESQLEMVKKLELDFDAHQVLIKRCQEKDIDFLSTPFDMESIDILVRGLNVSQLKIASGEISNGPLLLKAARSGKPIILSTGMSSLDDVEKALKVLAFGYIANGEMPSLDAFQKAYDSEAGHHTLRAKVILLHCTTEYPAPFDEVNLLAMDTLKSHFDLRVGFSDHTPGIAVPIAAAARGAKVIEKHFTLDRHLPGPDHQASLEPQELKQMVEAIRQVEQAIGYPSKEPTASELKNLPIARKSLVAAQAIQQGEVFTEQNITAKRPGNGFSPMFYWSLLGKIAARDYSIDEMITDQPI
ncbi:MAG: N-acetylneuraminate synthase [Acidobacteriota bacterium]